MLTLDILPGLKGMFLLPMAFTAPFTSQAKRAHPALRICFAAFKSAFSVYPHSTHLSAFQLQPEFTPSLSENRCIETGYSRDFFID